MLATPRSIKNYLDDVLVFRSGVSGLTIETLLGAVLNLPCGDHCSPDVLRPIRRSALRNIAVI
jgi:hypothetical protein